MWLWVYPISPISHISHRTPDKKERARGLLNATLGLALFNVSLQALAQNLLHKAVVHVGHLAQQGATLAEAAHNLLHNIFANG